MQPYQGRSPIINVTSNACVFAGKKFLRDFLEIENLQVTKKDIYRFYNNAILNLEKSLDLFHQAVWRRMQKIFLF